MFSRDLVPRTPNVLDDLCFKNLIVLDADLFVLIIAMALQVMLLNAAKDVTGALSDLINATKNASGKGAADPTMDSLKSAAKV